MGQYHLTVNLDKREFIHPHRLGAGLKLGEFSQTATFTTALCALLACSNGRGGGDLPENAIVGRWSGDRIAIIGDYADDGDLPQSRIPASLIYGLCVDEGETPSEDSIVEYCNLLGCQRDEIPFFKDISALVIPVVEKDMGGKFFGDGWRRFVMPGDTAVQWADGSRSRIEGRVTEVNGDGFTVEWPGGTKRHAYTEDNIFIA